MIAEASGSTDPGRMDRNKQHVLIKQVMQVAERAPYKRLRFEPTCMIVNSIHLRGLYD
jgi:hypothetical protein